MHKLLLASVLLFFSIGLLAQKKPLDHSVYDGWQHIGERMISNDGKWIVYTIDPQEGDNELVIQSSDANYKKSIPRGYAALITEDSRYVIFKIKPFYKDTRDARIKKKRTDDFPKDSIAIVELGKEQVWKSPRVKTYKTPQKGFGWIAYHLEKPFETPSKTGNRTINNESANTKRLNDSLNHIIDSLENVIATMPQKKKKNKDEDDISDFRLQIADFADGDDATMVPSEVGTDLVLRKLENGEEKVFNNVLEFYFNKTGEKLLIEQSRNPKDSLSKPMVILYDLKAGNTITLSKGGNDFKNFAISDDGSQVAYVAERDAKPKDLQKFYKLWYYRTGMDSAVMMADRNAVGMRLGMTISEYGNLSFSKSGKRLFFGTSLIQPLKDTTIIDIDMPKVDIWNYKDDYLQTVQTYPARLRNDLQQNFLAVYNTGANTIRQLATLEMPQVLQTNDGDGDTFVGVTDYGKRVESQWQGYTLRDIYAIDVTSGDKKLVKENLYGQVYPSSTGKYIMWYDRKAKNYFAWDGKTTRNISDKIKVPLYNEENDTPDEPGNYGVMSWHQDDSVVYVYDKYDVWAIDPQLKKSPRNVTKAGRVFKDVYRYIRVDNEERYIKPNQLLYFRFQNQDVKSAGIRIGNVSDTSAIVFALIGGDYMYDGFQVAEQSRNFIYTKERFNLSPDIYSNDQVLEMQGARQISHEVKLSSINPQQSNYLWGTAELFKWKAYNGKDATGIVYKPENFDPKKKYPMICYFYEKLSDGLYDYKEPAPIRSAINVPFFVSRGYIIFMPDITYKTGHPGQGAYDYIVSGARALVKKGWVDSTNMALQGHSWGGYQAAQVATMTKLFKAIWAGAPVANMTSAYGGIRWESGVSRQFQYERTQSRIGGSLWEKGKLPLYLENSPLFHLDKVTAPMVIMSNDADGAVPWYQGIELFTGLRRLGKKVWLFNYNGQGHGLTQRQDMRDYQIRMQQFFDWILKGEAPARWITEGVPAVRKGKDWGLETDASRN